MDVEDAYVTQTGTEKVRIYKELCKGVEGCGICLSVCRQELFKPSSGC